MLKRIKRGITKDITDIFCNPILAIYFSIVVILNVVTAMVLLANFIQFVYDPEALRLTAATVVLTALFYYILGGKENV